MKDRKRMDSSPLRQVGSWRCSDTDSGDKNHKQDELRASYRQIPKIKAELRRSVGRRHRPPRRLRDSVALIYPSVWAHAPWGALEGGPRVSCRGGNADEEPENKETQGHKDPVMGQCRRTMTMEMKMTYLQGTEGSEGVKGQGTELGAVVNSTDAARTFRKSPPWRVLLSRGTEWGRGAPWTPGGGVHRPEEGPPWVERTREQREAGVDGAGQVWEGQAMASQGGQVWLRLGRKSNRKSERGGRTI